MGKKSGALRGSQVLLEQSICLRVFKSSETRTGFAAKKMKVYFRELHVLETQELPLKGLTSQISQRDRLHGEAFLVMDTKGVGVMGATDWIGRGH